MYLRLVISLLAVMIGFSIVVTSIVTYNQKEKHDKGEIIFFIVGAIIFIIGVQSINHIFE